MRNLYSKNNNNKKKKSCSSSSVTKKKVHPSPQSSSPGGDALAAALALLRVLPAALLALAAPLPAPDKEVLAYLISRSLKPSPSAGHHHHHRRGSHSPLLMDCGCFNCYTRFWTRWDSSPHRDLIQRVIDAFDDHLSNSEDPRPPGSRKQRRDKRPPTKPLLLQDDVKVQEGGQEEVEESGLGQFVEIVEEDEGERRRSTWPDVMGILNSRFWSLWSPS